MVGASRVGVLKIWTEGGQTLVVTQPLVQDEERHGSRIGSRTVSHP